MAKRVLLMNPPSELYRRDDRCQSKVEDQTVRVVFPPVELGVLASIARNHGADVLLKDYPTVGATLSQYEQDLKAFEPDFVLLNTTAHTIAMDMEAFAVARRHFPRVQTVAKGEAVAVLADRTLREFTCLDIVLDGEPEDTVQELLESRPLEQIQGIIWRDAAGEIRHNQERSMIRNLDLLPHPAHDLFEHHLYRSPENNRPITAIYAQRGCPAKCIFCPAGSMYGYKVRERSVPHVIAEIRDYVTKYGIRDFLFHGDTFTLHKKWIIELCQAILDEGLDIRWGCNSRVDTIDDERAAIMKKAGCWVVAFGFEHGSQEILDKMKKGQQASRAHDAAAVCRRHGLKVQGFFVIGMPWETRETLDELLRFVKALDLDFFDFNIGYPLPGTEFHEIVERDGLWEAPDPLRGGYAQAAVRTYALSSKELTEWRKGALLRMYARPNFILRTLKNAASTGNTRHYAKAAMQRISSLLAIR